MKRLLLILLAFIPGSVSILHGRSWTGILLMVVAFFGWDFAVMGFSGVLHGADALVMAWIGLVAALCATLFSVVTTILATSQARLQSISENAERALRSASEFYLRGKTQEAELALEGGLRYAKSDIDLVFFRWRLAVEAGDFRRARKLLRRLRRLDLDEKWAWEIEREEKRHG